jgi:hypothetical protein
VVRGVVTLARNRMREKAGQRGEKGQRCTLQNVELRGQLLDGGKWQSGGASAG